MKKQVLSLILALGMIVGLLPVKALAQTDTHSCYDDNGDYLCDTCSTVLEHDCADEAGDGYCDFCNTQLEAAQEPNPVEGLTYEIKEGEVWITGANRALSGALTIPATIEGLPVTTIGRSAFYYCSKLTSVVLPDSVTTIEAQAFKSCSALTNIRIGKGVTSIGYDAFSLCSELTYTIYENGQYLGNEENAYHAFVKYTSGQSTAVFHPQTKMIADYAYYGSGKLTQVIIPQGVTAIGSYAFRNCTALTSITMPDGVSEIGVSAFQDCKALTSITIPNGVAEIGASAFYNCTALTEVTLGTGSPFIGKDVFGKCANLKNIYITDLAGWCGIEYESGNALTSGSPTVYLNGTVLTELMIPEGVTKIKAGAFRNISTITSVTIPSSVNVIEKNAFYGCNSIERVNITDLAAWCLIDFADTTANPIGEAVQLYLNDTLLTEVIIPQGITEIKNYAFEDCQHITTVTIPQGVTAIGSSAFNSCSSLASVTIPESVTDIGKSAFSGCSGLVSVTIPEGVTTIHTNTFYRCKSLTDLVLPNGITTIDSYAFEDCDSLTEAIIPDSVTIIGQYAFRNCNNLSTVVIGNGVEEIGYEAFYGCPKLTDLTLGNSVRTIGSNAFRSSGITSLVLPDSVTSIGMYAFWYCQGITDITIGDGVTYLTACAFGYCTSLTSVTFGCNVTRIGQSSFEGCKSLTEITIPDGVTRIDESAFEECTGLTTVNMPNSVSVIDPGAFRNCSSLAEITLGTGLSSLGDYAFQNCSNLATIRFAGAAPTFGDASFSSLTTVVQYPENAPSWTDEVRTSYGGSITWQSYQAEHTPGNWFIAKAPTTTEEGRKELRCITCDTLLATKPMEKLVAGTCGDNVTWVLDPNTGLMTISGTGAMYDYNWSRGNPAPWYDYSYYSYYLKEVVIEEGVTYIGDSAFYECRYLQRITIPESITAVGYDVITYCDALTCTRGYFASQVAYYLGTAENPYHALVKISNDRYWSEAEGYPTLTLTVASGCKVIANDLCEYAYAYYLGVKLPDSVLYIGSGAFRYAKTFNLPANVLSIGNSAFQGSEQSGTLSIPRSVKYLGSSAFSGCTNLTGVIFPDTLAQISNSAFSGCTGLTGVSIQEGVTQIGSYAFDGCTGLTTITIPNSVTHIGYGAFQYCKGLITVYVGTGLKSVDSYAFGYCDPIEDVYIKDMAAWCAIDFGDDGSPFIYATNLYLNGELVTDLVIPDGVTVINSGTFASEWEGNTLKTLTLPASVKTIEDGAFTNTYIRHVYITDLKAWCDCDMGEYGIVNASPSYLYLNGEMITDLVVPEGVTTLRRRAFHFLGGISTVTLPESLEVIKSQAFDGCVDLTQITIPAGVKYIGKDAMESGKYELSLHFLGDAPELESSIGYASQNTYVCYSSKAAGWTEEYMASWSGKYVWVKDHSIPEYVPDGNAGCITDGTQTGTCQYCGTPSTIPMPAPGHTPGEWIVVVEPTAEYDGWKERRCAVCDEILETVTLNRCATGTCGENLTWHLDLITGMLTISGTGAMMDGSTAAIPWKDYTDIITAVTVEEGVTTIGNVAFSKCPNLTTITLPDTLSAIGNYAFYECTALSEIILPDGLTSIGTRAFCYCTALSEITIPQGVTQLEDLAFLECDNLTTVILPDTMTVIGEKAFFGCDSLQNINLPAALTSLGDQSLYKCAALTTITIPENVTAVGSYAFYNCYALKEITFTGDAPTMASDAFKNVTATAWYPANWAQTALQNYGGTITWVPVAEELTQPTLTLKYPTVSFEDEIVMNIYFAAVDLENVTDMGLITYSAAVDSCSVDTAEIVTSGYQYSETEQLYCVSTEGIAAKDMENTIYFAVYAKLTDGSYVYTKLASYSPASYASTLLATGTPEMKRLMAATLSYGGAAQNYFGQEGTLTNVDTSMIEAYRADMMNPVVQPDTGKIGDFERTGGFTSGYPTVSFEGAFSINYYFNPANTVASDVQLYYWTADDYSSADVLTADNATGILTMEAPVARSATGYQAAVEGIAAKDLDDTVYVACVYSDGETQYCSGVLAYSIGAYCVTLAAKTGTLADFAAATAVYGYYARELFG